MGSVAAAMAERGYVVTGSDENVYPPMSTFLKERGIELMSGYRAENIPAGADVVVIGNAMSRGNAEVEAALEQRKYYLSLPETVKEQFLRGRRNFVVTGTHGKTTTTSMLAWILDQAGLEPGFLIGGIPRNFGRGAEFRESDYFVIEGDEYDTAFFDKRSKFHHYLPEVVIMNNVEFDHADIFPDLAAVKLTFQRLIHIIPRNGLLVINSDDPVCVELAAAALCRVARVGLGEGADYRIEIAQASAGEGARTDYRLAGEEFSVPMLGEFNVRNAAMATVAARFAGVNDERCRVALGGFQGIARRLELKGEAAGVQVYDDFGHHPTAIKETLKTLRQRYPGRRLWALFEPRSNTTRRSVFQQDLPEALGLADGVAVAQVARLEQIAPEERLDPERVVEDLRKRGRQAFYEEDAGAIVQRISGLLEREDIVVTFSNGAFGGIHQLLLDRLQANGAPAVAAG